MSIFKSWKTKKVVSQLDDIGVKKNFALKLLKGYATKEFIDFYREYVPEGGPKLEETKLLNNHIEFNIEHLKEYFNNNDNPFGSDEELDEYIINNWETKSTIVSDIEDYYDSRNEQDYYDWKQETEGYSKLYEDYVEMYYNDERIKVEVEKVKQEVIEGGWKYLRSYESKSSLSHYLYFDKPIKAITKEEVQIYNLEEEYDIYKDESEEEIEIRVRVSDHGTPADGAFYKEDQFGNALTYSDPNYAVVVDRIEFDDINTSDVEIIEQKYNIYEMIVNNSNFEFLPDKVGK